MEIPVPSTPTPPTQGRGWGLDGFMFDGPEKAVWAYTRQQLI